jgi:DNA replication protein DnaC
MGEALQGQLQAIRDAMMMQRSTESLSSEPSKLKCEKCGGLKLIKAEADGIYERYVPCECSLEERKAEMWKNRNVPLIFEDAWLSAFKAEYYSPENRSKAEFALQVARKTVEDYELLVESFNGRGVYLHSKQKGSGKSLIAAIIVNEMVARGIRAKFIGMAELLQKIRDGFDPASGVSSAEIIETAKSVPVMVIDDIGAERLTEWVEDMVYQILDYRLANKKLTIFTSNDAIEELKYDDRIRQRIGRMSMVVSMPEESVRLKLSRRDDRRMAAFFGGGQ